MKKILFIVFVGLFSLPTQVQAQVIAGVQAKLSGYKLSEPNRDYRTSFKPGFEFGAFARVGIAEIFYLQPELGFSYIAGKISPEEGNYLDYKSAAFTIPVLFGINVVEASEANFRVYVGLGNTISVLNNIDVMKDALEEYAQGVSLPHKIETPSYEISGLVGVGFDMMDITIDLRYGRTFNYTIIRDNDKFYQNTFSIAIGYKMIKP